MMKMRVLVGMECSGIIRAAFRRRGHDAFSCDFKHPEDGSPYHYTGDFFYALGDGHWDLVIVHPECTKLTVSGNWIYAAGKPRHSERLEAIEFTEMVWKKSCQKAKRVCLENPVGVLSTSSCLRTVIRQTIQPHQFNEDASKATVLFLKGLMPLVASGNYPPRMVEWPRGSGKMVPRWGNQTDSGQNKLGPSESRAADRARTYLGIATAKAEQWG